MPYIYGRLKRVLGDKEARKLSPWNYVSEREVVISGRTNKTCDIAGVTQLDYLELYKKFTYTNQESYRLDHIANVELVKRNSITLSLILSRISIMVIGRSL